MASCIHYATGMNRDSSSNRKKPTPHDLKRNRGRETDREEVKADKKGRLLRMKQGQASSFIKIFKGLSPSQKANLILVGIPSGRANHCHHSLSSLNITSKKSPGTYIPRRVVSSSKLPIKDSFDQICKQNLDL